MDTPLILSQVSFENVVTFNMVSSMANVLDLLLISVGGRICWDSARPPRKLFIIHVAPFLLPRERPPRECPHPER